ncbi:hypothetical protein AUC60_22890 [Pseudomonas caspiana]|uniref:Uncharacterized protein n=1 Tax=Pseudomonas caspiana TaxID=1451454 RepID=A0A1Y3P1R6_9PSED|nr:hypothetical protein AUC60_22890 [Pseudomonas caspiana]
MHSLPNTSNTSIATPFANAEKLSRHITMNQTAAMNAALMIGGQYSLASKTKFRRKCLDHLKASLVPARNFFA